jgi:hypothetical protein
MIPPYRPTKGKFCIIAESPVNIGFRMLQKSAGCRSTVAAVVIAAAATRVFLLCA